MTAWTRDGRFLVGVSSKGLAWVPASGGVRRELLPFRGPVAPWSFAPDGRLAFATNLPATALDIWTVRLTPSDSDLGAGVATPLLASQNYEAYPAYSPDGHWLAFTSNESGQWEIYVRGVADTSTKVQVSRGGGRVPRWSRARDELFYATDDQRVMVAKYEVRRNVFVAGKPREWTTERFAETGVFPNFDVTPDGRRLLALVPVKSGDAVPAPNHVTLLFNFAEELRRRLPRETPRRVTNTQRGASFSGTAGIAYQR
jgi:dipeptidyl aminopeptidase/acylaminoacyl peptidase